MPNAATCPTPQELELFLGGELSDEEADRMESHLAGCQGCVTALGQLRVEDRLVKAVRHAKPAPPTPIVARLVKRLSAVVLPPAKPPADGSVGSAANGPPTTEVYSLLLGPPQQRGDLGRLGAYRVLRVLGAGGMGVVFEGEDTQLQRRVALKVMKPAMTTDPICRQRFLHEARAAAAIEHPNIVSIFQVSEDRGVPFLAMQLLRGQTLAARLNQVGRLPIAEVLSIGQEIAAGLAAAHKPGLVHRDIKPGNIWLEADDNRVKILDFGLASVVQEGTSKASQAAIIGTPDYMPPEQCRGAPPDFRADLYSFGCVLYEMCTGRMPIEGRDTAELLLAVAVKKPVSPDQLNSAVPPELSALILQLLAKDPAERPASAKAVGDVLAAISYQPQEGSGTAPLPIRSSPPDTERDSWVLPRSPRRRQRARMLGVACGALLIGGLVFLTRPFSKAPESHSVPVSSGAEAPVSEPHGQPLPAKAAPPDKAKPFVVIRAMGGKVDEFDDFRELRQQLRADDIVEVHGNGPYLVDQIVLWKIGLNLRAAPGYRPRFVPKSYFGKGGTVAPMWFAVTDAPFQIEGCDFFSPYPNIVFFGGNSGPKNIRNCRLVSAGSSLIEVANSRVRISDCLIVTGARTHSFTLGQRSELELVNNLLRASSMDNLIGCIQPGGQVIRMQRNSILLGGPIWFSASTKVTEPVHIHAEGNLLFLRSGWREQEKAPLKQKLCWHGRDNLYLGQQSTSIQTMFNQKVTQGLTEWLAYWGDSEKGSEELSSLALGWDRLVVGNDPQGLRKLHDRLAELRKLDATDLGQLGPDLERLGSGKPYEEFRAQSDPEISKEGRPQPLPNGPCVLWRNGKIINSFPLLQAAVDIAQAGDMLELRTDGPLYGATFLPKLEGITIRAAPGYRPVLESPLDGLGQGPLTVEGVHFNAPLPRNITQVRLINCSCIPASGSCNLVEAVNCWLPIRLRLHLPRQGAVTLRNSVIGGLSLHSTLNADYQIVLDRCVVIRNDMEAFLSGATGPGRVKVTARSTLFECQGWGLGQDGELFGRTQGPVLSAWMGSNNAYCLGPSSWIMADPEPITTLAAWQTRWQSDANSREVELPCLDPRSWRLPADGLGGKTFGADVDQVIRPPQAGPR